MPMRYRQRAVGLMDLEDSGKRDGPRADNQLFHRFTITHFCQGDVDGLRP